MLKNKKNLFFICVVQLIILAFCVLPAVFCNYEIINSIIYFAFQLFGILIPGFALYLLLFKDKKNGIECMLWSYAGGVFIVLIEYALLMIMNISKYSTIVHIVLSVSSMLVIRAKKTEICFDSTDSLFVNVVLAVLLLISFFSVTYQNPLPNNHTGNAYNNDFLFWVGNCLSFTKGLPVQSYRLPGVPFFYHYFSNIFIAQSSFITHIDVVDVCFIFSYIVPCVLLSTSSYILFNRVTEVKPIKYLGMIGTLLSEGFSAYLIYHLYFCSFGFDYGYAFSMMSISVLIDIIKNNDYSFKNIVASCLLISLTTGFKGPNGIVILMAFGITTLSLLIKKEFKKAFMCGSAWLSAFLLVYCIFVSGLLSSYEQTNNLSFSGIAGAFDQNFWAIEIFSRLIGKGMPDNAITRIIAIFLYVIRVNRLSMYLLIVCSIMVFIDAIRKDINIISACLMMTCIWGIMLTITTYQNGNSQMYFIMSVIPFGIASGINSLKEHIRNKKAIIVILCALMMFALYDDLNRSFFERIKPEIENSIRINRNTENIKHSGYYLSDSDYEMASWLKNNTDSCDYIAVDVFDYYEMKKEEVFGVFSERFIWNDGDYEDEEERDRRRTIVNSLFEGNMDALEVLKEEKVKYVVQTLAINGHSIIEEDKASLVYDSEEYKIYKIY